MPDPSRNALEPQELTSKPPLAGKCALVTGGARRIGAAIVRALHGNGATVALHYRDSQRDARALAEELNAQRANSLQLVQADLLEDGAIAQVVTATLQAAGRLDILINNASSFYPTRVGSIKDADWDDLFGTNAKAPLFLAQAAASHLRATHGCVINLIDIHAFRPLAEHPVYCAAKAALCMLTRSLAQELAPEVRVNGIAPGSILWPEAALSEEEKQAILRTTPLGRQGRPDDIGGAALYLVRAPFVTGQIIAVDGGRSIGGW